MHEIPHTPSHACSPLLLWRDTGRAVHSSLSLVSRLAGCMPASAVGLLDDPGQVSSPFIALFFHLQNAGSYCLLHPVGAYKTALFSLALAPACLTPRKRQNEKFSLKLYQ